MARKRKNGQGTVRLRSDGRWEGRHIVGYDENGKAKQKSVLAKTKAECVEKLKKLLLYAGAEPEDFARCQMDVQIANRRRLTAFLGTACAFFVALTLGSCMVPLLFYRIN